MRQFLKFARPLQRACNCYLRNQPSIWKNTNILVRHTSSSAYSLDLTINNVSLNNYIAKLEEEYASLKSNSENGGRYRQIQPVINILNERKTLVDNINNLSDLLNDKDDDIKKLAQEEQIQFEERIKHMDTELEEALLPVDEDDACNSIVLEVNSGVGGQEAMLFARELFDMYTTFAEYKGFECATAEYLINDLGGLRHGSLLIKGPGVFASFKHEAGVHRVQRIPETEKAGRTHTSTVSVNALPAPTDIEVELHNKDLKIETKRSTGAGGQHVNTTDSAVRIVHLPTGIAIECQVDRSQIKNRQMAMERLRAKLYQVQLDQQVAETSATRKNQVRSNFRNEKIRTYNFSQDRITDHRLQSSNIHNLKVFILGGEPLEALITKLRRQSQINNLLQIVSEMNS